MATPYAIEWTAGPTCEIQVISPESDSRRDPYRIRFTPPFRSTLRPPLADAPVGEKDTERVRQNLRSLAGKLTGGRAGTDSATGGVAGPAPAAEVSDDIAKLGAQLFRLVIPKHVRPDLNQQGLFLEFGADERLLTLPWELMYNGTDFLCLRHNMGRFVSGIRRDAIPSTKPRESSLGRTGDLSVLLISVPTPQPRADDPNRTFDTLGEAKKEETALTQFFLERDIEVEALSNATYNEVYDALDSKRYDIVHYIGHASFDQEQPKQSALVLKDNDMTSGVVTQFFEVNPPVLCFVNACEATRIADLPPASDDEDGGIPEDWDETYNVFGLARGFLDTGAYLLGSRWRIRDNAACVFALSFYKALLDDGLPVGHAVREARLKCKADTQDPFAWASYVYYGDPRICFRKQVGGV